MSTPSADQLPLAPDGAPPQEDWEGAVAAVLRRSGRLTSDDPDSAAWGALTTTTLDGIPVLPLGTPDTAAELPDAGLPGQVPFTRGTTATRPFGSWDIRARFEDPDAELTAQHVTEDLENGVNSLWLVLGDAGIAIEDLDTVLEPVLLDLAPVVLDAPQRPVLAASEFVRHMVRRGVQPAAGTNLGANPIGHRDKRPMAKEVVRDVADLAVREGLKAVMVDGTAVHDRGGSDVQELAYTIAAGAEYLRLLAQAGHDPATAARLIEFRYAATAEQFPTIAKFRAARRLWARVLELSHVDPARQGQSQHAVTSRPMMTRYDPYTNMLRTTVAAFSAGVGGAGAVTVLPFDEPLGLPESFSRRIARNTSSLLAAEAHIAEVTDPAGGSHAVERLTEDLAVAAWELFGRVEEDGGLIHDLRDGSWDRAIAEVVQRRRDQVARRTRPITGLTEFPQVAETLPHRRAYAVPRQVVRHGADFENLRDQPAPHPLFVATMGTVAQHTARATFLTNLLAAGGITAHAVGSSTGVEDVLAAYHGEKVVALAGTDQAYAEWGPDLVTALRGAGAQHVLLAGKPVEGLEVDDNAAMGLDALAFLHRTRERLGVTADPDASARPTTESAR
ncbi:methylmalonyl-CoA mutase subunit beta [Ornithinimicrobium cryptoxanthini]|uniref:Methylmalonyl-CoA mutase subunit beta n=1 Tax=Ornithinimicrobium cryptoxanthini TaxID=2934161 RepID=A0ABY4YKM1_9MICO|nr:methylmalonyl-CoA mutase subunit beta [Ornithinimicrobium cryptoxanthini]USQ77266.1 methylmalonyl-CoA mutase subunit beta [Ornithinimicrobium cryptoxanthini]